MKSFIPIQCNCGEPLKFEINGTQLPEDGCCPKCHTAMWFIQPLGNFVASLILGRASAELKGGDFTLVILLSAMAVESEMSRLFIKWRGMDWMRSSAANGMPTQENEDAWAEEWRKLFAVKNKLDELSKVLTCEDFDSFCLARKYPALSTYASPKDCFQKELFNKRNKIAHSGEIDSKQADGQRCFELAYTLLKIMEDLDTKRRIALEAALDAERAAREHKP